MAKALPSLDIAEAAHQVTQDYGVSELAALMAMPQSTLYNKANPNDMNAQLTAAEVVVITSLTRDYRLIEALCRSVGGAFFMVPKLDHVADAELLSLFGKIAIEEGHMHQSIAKAFEDGRLRKDEFKMISVDLNHLHSAVAELGARLEGMIIN